MLDEVNCGLPLRRHADPSEVARLFLFLASDWAAYITGQAIVIDGGELA
jgi:NAD(P)-dependent dehydrogenase (short-subunit alcohol dehydrogenase family)